jgi:hypothetical protein
VTNWSLTWLDGAKQGEASATWSERKTYAHMQGVKQQETERREKLRRENEKTGERRRKVEADEEEAAKAKSVGPLQVGEPCQQVAAESDCLLKTVRKPAALESAHR